MRRRRITAMTMALAALALTAGVGGLGAGVPAMQGPDDAGFSPLFARRLDLGIQRLDQPADRTLTAAMQVVEEEVEFIASGTPYSYCLGSLCGGSTCLGSACVGSTCLGSGCLGSTCAGSACSGSTCLGSVCVGSKCLGSVCGSCPAEEPMRRART